MEVFFMSEKQNKQNKNNNNNKNNQNNNNNERSNNNCKQLIFLFLSFKVKDAKINGHS